MYLPCMIVFTAAIFSIPLDIPYKILDCSDCCIAYGDEEDYEYDYDMEDFVPTDLK